MPSASSFVLSGIARDGYTTSTASTATCFCGAVQLEFPLEAPGLVSSFVCHCYDCRKITASMFASNFIVLNSHLKHLRGGANLSSWGQAATIESGHRMTNHFCKTYGTLMYRVSEGFPESKVLRIGTVDDFSLHETILKPSMEQYVKDRVGWLKPAKGMRQSRVALASQAAGGQAVAICNASGVRDVCDGSSVKGAPSSKCDGGRLVPPGSHDSILIGLFIS